MRRSLPLRRNGSAGQALVEFALVAPLFFLLLLGIFEAGRFVLNLETLNNATREGARYAIVHGAKSACPSGPMPGAKANPCDSAGANVKTSVANSAVGFANVGRLSVADPMWTAAGSTILPDAPGDPDVIAGDNGRGNYVTVFADYAYEPMIKMVFGGGAGLLGPVVSWIPTITMSARSSLVINN